MKILLFVARLRRTFRRLEKGGKDVDEEYRERKEVKKDALIIDFNQKLR